MDDSFFDRVLGHGKQRVRDLEATEMYLGFIEGETAPHCDARVLHSPGQCVYCDAVPHLQVFRRGLGLPYTDELQVNDPLLPGENRSRASAEAWGGNKGAKDVRSET